MGFVPTAITLDYQINVGLRLLNFEHFSKGYTLICKATSINFPSLVQDYLKLLNFKKYFKIYQSTFPIFFSEYSLKIVNCEFTKKKLHQWYILYVMILTFKILLKSTWLRLFHRLRLLIFTKSLKAMFI